MKHAKLERAPSLRPSPEPPQLARGREKDNSGHSSQTRGERGVMKRLIMLAVLAACNGGVDITELQGPSVPEPQFVPGDDVEKNTYVLPDGFGTAAGGAACHHAPFPGGFCSLPLTKRFCTLKKTDARPADDDLSFTAWAAVAQFENLMQSLGWAKVPLSACAASGMRIEWRFADTPNALGRTRPRWSNPAAFDTQWGEVRPYAWATVEIDAYKIARADWLPDSGKEMYAYNVTMHELMHAVGLGHNAVPDALMGVISDDPDDEFFSTPLFPLPWEQDLVEDYDVY